MHKIQWKSKMERRHGEAILLYSIVVHSATKQSSLSANVWNGMMG